MDSAHAGYGLFESPTPDSARAFVLLVDDDFEMSRIAARFLHKRGLRTYTESRVREALKRIATGKVDVLVTDLVMPEMSGFELARRARRLMPRLPVIVISAYPSAAAIVQDELVGAVFMEKPLRHFQLLATINRALADRGGATVPRSMP
jgi:DNA-binding NtrC family response regulator